MLMALLFAAQVFAVEPVNPEGVCDRFIGEADQAACLKRAKSMDLDWYAVAVCNLVDDDDAFNDCWKKIDGRSFAPRALEKCAAADLEDEARVTCLTKVNAAPTKDRAPASGGAKVSTKPVYQPLKIGN